MQLCQIYIFTLFLINFGHCAQKIRYHKSLDRRRVQYDIFGFTNEIEDLDFVTFSDPPPFTTPTTATTTTTTTRRPPSRQPRPLSEYCLQSSGQFIYPPDCHKFVNCGGGQVFLQSCNSLVFDPITKACQWPQHQNVRGLCDSKEEQKESIETNYVDENAYDEYYDEYAYGIDDENFEAFSELEETQETDFSKPLCSDFAHLGYTCVPDPYCLNGIVRNISTVDILSLVVDVRSGIMELEPSGRFSPWMKDCPKFNNICCRESKKSRDLKKQNEKSITSSQTSLCPSSFTGLQPYPQDCKKFANCWKGHPTIQSCAPGTEFNANLGQCDFPHKAKCEQVRDYLTPTEDGTSEVTRKSAQGDSIVFSSPPSGQNVRLRGGRAPYVGYVELFRGGEWGLVCDSGSWTMKEAEIVCKQLGFERGVRATTQVGEY